MRRTIDTTSERAKELDQMADQIDREKYGHGFASAALREYAALIRIGIPESLAERVSQESPKR